MRLGLNCMGFFFMHTGVQMKYVSKANGRPVRKKGLNIFAFRPGWISVLIGVRTPMIG